MKTLMALMFLCIQIFACTGDCLTCHPNLVPTINTDTRHKPMLGCIECHSADPNSMAECGSDCFACHPVEKIESVPVEAHKVIRGCRDCHLELERQTFGVDLPSGQSHQEPLKEFLLH